MEPKTQVEIQLGHVCNNRCVFCVSGQRTALGMARPVAVDPILEQIRAAYEAGNRKITLLGGEPTLQPRFFDIVRAAVDLGYEEIVIFSNGVRTARAEFVDRILATGGRFNFRFSFQGATKGSHEATTLRPGSFDRLVQSLKIVSERKQKLTVNMCVVRSNYESVDRFPELLLPYGVEQLHLDMVRPLDAGDRTEEELRAMMPRYSDLVGPLERMVAGFPEGFDVNIGNLPYCVAPHLAGRIHHDGERTLLVSVDLNNELSAPWDKYEVKRQRDKLKPASCAECVFDDRCTGVFEKYREFYGLDELVPVTPERLRAVDPERRLFAAHLHPAVRRLHGWSPPEPFRSVAVERRGEEIAVTLGGPERLEVALRPPGGGVASCELFRMDALALPADGAVALAGLCAVWEQVRGAGGRVWHEPGEDATLVLAASVAARLGRLRAGAPLGPLTWVGLRILEDGARAEVSLAAPDGGGAVVWLAETGGRASGGYRVVGEGASPALREGLGAVIAALRRGPRASGRGLSR